MDDVQSTSQQLHKILNTENATCIRCEMKLPIHEKPCGSLCFQTLWVCLLNPWKPHPSSQSNSATWKNGWYLSRVFLVPPHNCTLAPWKKNVFWKSVVNGLYTVGHLHQQGESSNIFNISSISVYKIVNKVLRVKEPSPPSNGWLYVNTLWCFSVTQIGH